MKVAVVGDTHSDSRFVQNVVALVESHQEPVRTVVQVGDFGYTFNAGMISAISAWLDQDPDNLWIWLDGNHDEHNYIEEVILPGQDVSAPISMGGLEFRTVTFPERLLYAPRGSVMELGDSRCMFLGGAYSIDERSRTPHVSWWPQETIREVDIVRAALAGKVDVMFTHDGPFNPTLDAMLNQYGYKVDEKSSANRAALSHAVRLARPKRLYHGHFHYRYDGVHTNQDGWEVFVHGVGANVNDRGYISPVAKFDENVLFVDL